jgi:hypothetical protein
MDTRKTYRDIIEQTLLEYARFRPSHGDIRIDPVFDEKRDHYALMQSGWEGKKRVRGNLVYIRISDGRVIIEYDGIGYGITDDLIAKGISEDKIIHAFQPLEVSNTAKQPGPSQ